MRDKWYITGLILFFLVICVVILGIRWHTLAARVPIRPWDTNAAAQAGDDGQAAAKETEQPAGSADRAERDRQHAKKESTDRHTDPPAHSTKQAVKLDINSASRNELTTLPGIGEVLAERIVAYREQHGDFKRVKDLLKVDGIGEAKLAAIEPLVCVADN
ncbi:helix-hairpin-helix domain-containing protein [bacterium]|nr:helix-hairpin-helix domain-containing protein [bacterium]